MNRQAAQLITRAAINKIGNMLYDYGNSIWLASLGALGQTVLGIYQISELVTSILFNPLGGAITDRFSRRKVLMVTDLICAGLCLLISFISNDRLMIGALIFANVVQAIAFAFSRPANKSYILPKLWTRKTLWPTILIWNWPCRLSVSQLRSCLLS